MAPTVPTTGHTVWSTTRICSSSIRPPCALRQPFISIRSDGTAVPIDGATAQGHPHPRYFGAFPRVLGRYVRDQKVLTLEEAIRQMTSVTIFDQAKIADRATSEQPRQYAVGVEYVF